MADDFVPCPSCKTGIMCEHDYGYDECDSCDFFAIYDPDIEMPEVAYKKTLAELARMKNVRMRTGNDLPF